MIIANSSNSNSSQTNISAGALLEQNVPNPFTNATTVNYLLPQKFATAQIVIIDRNGKLLRQVDLSGSGKGSVNVDASMLSSGAYSYSLIIDGKIIATKQMEHIK
jgi:hypothetical protein